MFRGVTGLNNRFDPMRHRFNPDTGMGELEEAVNVDIDDSGMISRRLGQVEISAGSFLNAFCDKGDCFIVQDRTIDSALFILDPDMVSLTGIRSGMTKGAMVSFCQVGEKTYYMNGYQAGVIDSGISYLWPDSNHLGASTTREYYSVPIGTHIAVFDGHMLVAEGNVLWISERYEFGKYRMAKNFFQMGSDIRMVKPVLNGIWISDQDKTGFIAPKPGQHISEADFYRKSSFPAHEWSDNIELVDLGDTELQIKGNSAIWSSDEGLCIGSENGDFEVSTIEKIIYPTGANGATVVKGYNVINSVY